MEDVESVRNSRRSLVLVPILALVLAAAGCQKTSADGPLDSSCKVKVKVVCIDEDGNADPDTVKVKKKEEIVVWIAPKGKKLGINFSVNPFPQPVSCPGGNFCASLFPPEGAETDYPYTTSVATATAVKTADPHLVVVP
jgi:hypothetical protein